MKRLTLFSLIAAAATAGSTGAWAMGSFAQADKSLSLAVYEAQADVGGTVLEIDRNGRHRGEPYRAVVLDPNGILQHVSFDLPVDWVIPERPVTTAQYTHAADLESARVRMIDAIRTAESIAGGRANKAAFVGSDDGRVIAYRVTFGSSRPAIFIDARTGEQMADAQGLDLTT